MKNEVFSAPRFWSYFKYDLTQMGRGHVKAAVGIGLMGLIFYVLYTAVHLITSDGQWHAPTLSARMFVFGLACFAFLLYQTRTYGYLTERRRGSAWLLLPASSFEKWLSMLILTLVVIPLLFLGAYMLVDSLIAWLDPTAGEPILTTAANSIKNLASEMALVNEDYLTSWNLGAFASISIAWGVANLLFFLLCGICFKMNKILGAFCVIFAAGLLTSLVGLVLPSVDFAGYEDPAQAEIAIRNSLKWGTAGVWILSALLAGAVFYRIKTLKY